MKKIISLIMFLLLIMTTHISFAETKLSGPIVDLIKSNRFLIRFSLTSESDSIKPDKSVQKFLKDLRDENTIIFDGQNALTIRKTFVREKLQYSDAVLYCNGESYAVSTYGKELFDASLQPNVKNIKQITHYAGPNNQQGRLMFESAYKQMIYYLLPLFPELNASTDIQGQTVHLNPCTVFSKTGEANYGGQDYQFEEYVTPNGNDLKMIVRYYFKDGKLVKVVQMSGRKEIDAGGDWKDAFGTEKVNTGSLSVLDVFEMTDSFNSDCLQVPQGIKIIDFESPF